MPRSYSTPSCSISDTQQLNSDVGGLRSFHPGVKEKETRTPLSKIKLLYSDPVKLEPEIEIDQEEVRGVSSAPEGWSDAALRARRLSAQGLSHRSRRRVACSFLTMGAS